MSGDERPDFPSGGAASRSSDTSSDTAHRRTWCVWFGANMELPVLAAGAATVADGLDRRQILVGMLFVAAHSAQGPHLGLPQMIQSRARFGYSGAAFPPVFVVFLYLGRYPAGVVLGAQALTALVGLPVPAGIVVRSSASAVAASFGDNLIHRAERYLSVLVAPVFGVLTVLLVAPHHSGAVMAALAD